MKQTTASRHSHPTAARSSAAPIARAAEFTWCPLFGGTEQKIAEGGRNPRFSPGGKWVAYWVGERGLNPTSLSKLYIVASTGGPAKQICPDLTFAADAVWSPDGKSLLFASSDVKEFSLRRLDRYDWWVVSLAQEIG
jgi:hypothetical protein